MPTPRSDSRSGCDVDVVCFTGSFATGRRVAVAAAERLARAQLEDHVSGPVPAKRSVVVDGAVMGAPLAVEREGAGAARQELGLLTLAASANGHVFAQAEPTAQDVDAFWADVDTARRSIRKDQGFWQRLRGDVSLRTFRDHLPDGSGLAPVVRRSTRGDGRRGVGITAGVGTAAPSGKSGKPGAGSRRRRGTGRGGRVGA